MNEYHILLTEKINLLDNPEEQLAEFDVSFKDIVLNFLFTFNVFESEFFEEPKFGDSNKQNNKTKTVRDRRKAMQVFCNNNYIENLELLKRSKSLHSHFKSIYFENGNSTARFISIKRSKENKTGCIPKDHEIIEKFLTNPLERNTKYAIQDAILISYIFRNNLFHGEKNLMYLKNYQKEFQVITKFVISLMKFFRDTNASDF